MRAGGRDDFRAGRGDGPFGRPTSPICFAETLSLLGLIRHLAQMENHWFQRVLQGKTDLVSAVARLT